MPNSPGIIFGSLYIFVISNCQGNYRRRCRIVFYHGANSVNSSYTDAYDLFAVNFANIMIGYVYTSSGTLATPIDTALKVAAPCGNVFGQFGFGFLADHVGRKKVYTHVVHC